MTDSLSTTVEKYVEDLKLMTSSMALIAMMVGLILFLIWRRTGIPRHLVGKERLVKVPWDWLEVFLAGLLLILVYDAAVELVPWGKPKPTPETFAGLQITAVSSVVQIANTGAPAGFLIPKGLLTLQDEQARLINDTRTRMVYRILFFPLALLILFNILPRFSGAKLYQMGLHLNRWRENFTLGALGWIVIRPLCTIILMIVTLEFWETLWGRSAGHPAAMLLDQDPRISTWLLVSIMVCVIAPLKEEILMRGIIQPYLMRNPITSDILIVFSVIWAMTLLVTPGTGPDRGMGMGPLFFVAVVAPGYYLFEKWTKDWIKEPGAARGIFATSLIFACLHGGAWPQPIPLFVFSLGVGFLAYRTRSLIGPITVHVLFNLTTLIMLVLRHYPNLKW